VNRLWTICANGLWFLACMPGYLRFRFSVRHVRRCQTKKMLGLLRANRETEYGSRHHFGEIGRWADFQALPVTDFADYRGAVERIMGGAKGVLTADEVRILQPTSGSTSAPKLIPHTVYSAQEFQSALDAWIADLFLQRPQLFLGSQYWSISPATEPKASGESRVPVGFLDDAEYFGKRRRWIMDGIMAVPAGVRHIADIRVNQYVTLLFLLRARDLRLISVWHPSFLTLLMGILRAEWPRLLDDLEQGGIDASMAVPAQVRRELERQLNPVPKRAAELCGIDLESKVLGCKIWPDLEVISCWREGNMELEIAELTTLFPDVLIQGKGLLATEGVVSIPMGPAQQQICAVTSHVVEFMDDSGVVFPVWSVKSGESYRVILTTAGGLYRYQLNDRVKVTGFDHQAPCLRFLGRAGVVSDSVGEKLHLEHVEELLGEIIREYLQEPRFVMLVPSGTGQTRGYNLLLEPSDGVLPDVLSMVKALDFGLCRNYHYAHARELGQLKPANVTMVRPDARNRYLNFMTTQGALAGTVKFPALCTAAGIESQLIGNS